MLSKRSCSSTHADPSTRRGTRAVVDEGDAPLLTDTPAYIPHFTQLIRGISTSVHHIHACIHTDTLCLRLPTSPLASDGVSETHLSPTTKATRVEPFRS